METLDLRKFDQAYAMATASEIFARVPDGRYQVVVENVELTTTKTTSNPMFKWKLRISGPKYANRLLWKNSVITENSLSRVKTELRLCGYEVDKLSPVEGRLVEFQGIELEVTKKGRNDGPDEIFFDKQLAAAALDDFQCFGYRDHGGVGPRHAVLGWRRTLLHSLPPQETQADGRGGA